MSAFDSHLDNYGDPGAGWANDEDVYDDQEAWDLYMAEEAAKFNEEAAAYAERRDFEEWADARILEDPNADVSAQAYAAWWVDKYEPRD